MKLHKLLIVVMGALLGYGVTRVWLVDSQVQQTHEAKLSDDAICSEASPEVATCEMPGEMSRADMFRLISPGSAAEPAQVIQEMARSKSEKSSIDADSRSPEEKP